MSQCPCGSCVIGLVDREIDRLRKQLNEAISLKDSEAVLRISQTLCAKNQERSAIYRSLENDAA
jgi:hypothetical protein